MTPLKISKEIVQRSIDDLTPYDKNPRTHSAEQIAQIAASITEFGFTNPILVADGEVVAGHGRLEASKLLGLEQVPVIDVSHLSAVQRRAYVISDNQLALRAGWDYALLTDELEELQLEGFDVTLTGFMDSEMESLKDVWDSDISDLGNDPANLEGIAFRIVIEVAEEYQDALVTLVTSYAEEHDIEILVK